MGWNASGGMGRKRGRGYVGQFSRNSMGRDRHSNPRYPPSTLSGSCSLFKQASNSILDSYSFSLSLPLFLSLSFSLCLSLVLYRFPGLSLSFSLSPFLAIRLSVAVPHPSFIVRLSLSMLLTQIRERYSGISTVAITTWISPVLHRQ